MTDLIAKLKKDYGVNKVYRWGGYADDKREKKLVKIIEDSAKFTGLSPSFLYTIAVGEGLGLWVNRKYDAVVPYEVRIQDSINGFDYLGVDHFDADFNRTKKYLPKNYNLGDEYTSSTHINEHGNAVQSGNFKNLKAGIQALAASIALRKNIFLSHCKSLNYIKNHGNPNVDQIAFWVYVYFQGEGRAKKYLESNGSYDYSKVAPSNMAQIRKLALERVAAWKYIQSKKIFSL